MASQVTDEILDLNIVVRNAKKRVTEMLIELEQQTADDTNEIARFEYLEGVETNLKAALDGLDSAWEGSRIVDRKTAA